MHDMSIATSVLDVVRAEAALRPGARILKVGLRIGELAGVNPDSLTFCFEVLVRGTDLDPLELAIENLPGGELDVAYLELEESDGTRSLGEESPRRE